MASNKFNLKVIGVATASVATLSTYLLVIRPWYRKWGATKAEIQRPLPGDDLVSQPKVESTRAVTIQARAADIWPWLVQIGQGRGGFYSYDWLENLIGCDIHNADQIIPEFQQLAVGDKVRLGPEGYPFYTVAAIEPEQLLLLHAEDPEQESPPVEDIWLFYLDETAPGVTRLIARNRRNYEPTLANFIVWQVVTEPLHFLMEQKMLRGIKERAERGGKADESTW
ncbi:MAG: hypothetical protein BroJett011_67790 [Chloroflexota bacterium]|nr:MAG: hypothetical protein BroJett011_67790 [Chloroflexota bacterium]